MEFQSIATALVSGLIMFFVGRTFSKKDKTDDRAEKLEDKVLQDLKSNIDEKFTKLEKSLTVHIEATDKAFDDLERANTEINKSLSDLKLSQERTSDKIEGNAKLNDQKIDTLNKSLEEIKKTIGSITQVTVKATRGSSKTS